MIEHLIKPAIGLFVAPTFILHKNRFIFSLYNFHWILTGPLLFYFAYDTFNKTVNSAASEELFRGKIRNHSRRK